MGATWAVDGAAKYCRQAVDPRQWQPVAASGRSNTGTDMMELECWAGLAGAWRSEGANGLGGQAKGSVMVVAMTVWEPASASPRTSSSPVARPDRGQAGVTEFVGFSGIPMSWPKQGSGIHQLPEAKEWPLSV